MKTFWLFMITFTVALLLGYSFKYTHTCPEQKTVKTVEIIDTLKQEARDIGIYCDTVSFTSFEDGDYVKVITKIEFYKIIEADIFSISISGYNMFSGYSETIKTITDTICYKKEVCEETK